MDDQFKRSIEYLRISITDRCNLRCSYCMPAHGVDWLPPRDILTYEEILRVVSLSVDLGFKKFRVTGGEPLVRKGVLPFLENLAAIPGVEDLALTTNGVLLAPLAGQLKAAGVRRVNVSLDTLDPAHQVLATSFLSTQGIWRLWPCSTGSRALRIACLRPRRECRPLGNR